MTTTLTKISAQKAHATIAHDFGGTFGDIPLRLSLAADHIRSILYANTVLANAHGFSPAVHTSRLLTSARKALDLLWAGSATEHMCDGDPTDGAALQTLNGLRNFGDIVDTGGGYWLGTPLRIVRSDYALLAIGAAPNAVLKTVFGAPPICAGISRFRELRTKDSTEHTISISHWLGEAKDILSWTKCILDQHEQKMQPGNEFPANQLEIFAPDFARAQRSPWISAQAVDRALPGARLCRPMKTVARAWDRPFYLNHFRFSAGGLVVSRCVRIDYSLTRRLRFGLSRLYNRNPTITATTNGELVVLEMPVALPNPESRITALGWPLSSNNRRLVFHRHAIPFVTEVMRRLAVPVIVR